MCRIQNDLRINHHMLQVNGNVERMMSMPSRIRDRVAYLMACLYHVLKPSLHGMGRCLV